MFQAHSTIQFSHCYFKLFSFQLTIGSVDVHNTSNLPHPSWIQGKSGCSGFFKPTLVEPLRSCQLKAGSSCRCWERDSLRFHWSFLGSLDPCWRNPADRRGTIYYILLLNYILLQYYTTTTILYLVYDTPTIYIWYRWASCLSMVDEYGGSLALTTCGHMEGGPPEQSLTPSQGWTGSGSWNLLVPTGGSAYGMPWNLRSIWSKQLEKNATSCGFHYYGCPRRSRQHRSRHRRLSRQSRWHLRGSSPGGGRTRWGGSEACSSCSRTGDDEVSSALSQYVSHMYWAWPLLL